MFIIYCIECLTPNYLYIGQTAHLIQRLTNHIERNGEGTCFTQKHGVKSWCVVDFADTRKEAIAKEELEYYRLLAKGYIVGGFRYLERRASRAQNNGVSNYVINWMTEPNVQMVLADSTLLSLRAKAKILAPLINKHPEAAMSILRRVLGRIK